eukprot:5704974-Amphidinium_carterae.1
MRPLVRNQLMYLSKSQFSAVRTLLFEARHQIDTVYYSRWQALLEIELRSLEGPVEVPPGLQKEKEEEEEVVEVQESNAAMAADGTFEQTFADQEPAQEKDNPDEQAEERPLAEYEKGDSDAESGTTIPPVDQWIHENADVLNQPSPSVSKK